MRDSFPKDLEADLFMDTCMGSFHLISSGTAQSLCGPLNVEYKLFLLALAFFDFPTGR